MRRQSKTVPALELREVSYSANGKRILDRVSWSVLSGEHWAILGPNGAGKTTLLSIACGYLWPNAGGSVLRQGKRLLDLRELRKSIGWVTSTLAAQIPPREQALRTVVSGKFAQVGLLEGFGADPSAQDYEQAARYLSEMGCAHVAEQEYGSLSQGEQQKVLIARARMAKPYLIFLDEPCAGMDPGARENFLASLERLMKQELVPAIVYVTHHVEEILPGFKRTLLLKDGRVLRAGRSASILQRTVLEDLYGVALTLIRKKGRFWPTVR
ncbi:MAG TPA: ATP-binding cassette domain-containing protein [Candidatus Acidoferrales bacterium]|nr:ATP-binding cassette domain-containing protein [Candidatus Acidoferrales bacterium]